MKTDFGILPIILVAALPLLGASDNNSGWENLMHVTKQRSYTIVTRDFHCLTGKLGSVTTDSLTLEAPKIGVINLKRADVLQVGSDPGYIVFSGRSSWVDVVSYHLYAGESFAIQTKNGKNFGGKHIKVSDSGVSLGEPGNTTSIAKAEVSKIDLHSSTPLGGGEEFFLRENPVIFWLDAHLWPRWIGIGGRIRVPLYDSSLPEDDRPITCQNSR